MRRLLFLFAVSSALFSCQKEHSYEDLDGTNSKYFISCEIDGVKRDFNFNTAAITYGFAELDSIISIMGFSSASENSQESITLNIYYSDITPGAGAYSENYNGTDYELAGIYNPNSQITVYSAGYASSSEYPLELVITERTATEISGAFEGAFYETDVDDGEIHPEYRIITNGKFRLKLD